MRFALGLVAAAILLAGCGNEQRVYTCRACLRSEPSKCGTYRGDCYGPGSSSMSASSTEEAEELAVQRVCSRYFEPIPATGLTTGCKVGLGFSARVRADARAQYSLTCSSRVVDCH